MKLDPNAHILGLDGKEIPGGPIIVADQLANLVLSDRGESAGTAREAYQLNALIEKIATAQEPVALIDTEVKLLKRVLDSAIKSKRISTFLVGRLYGLLMEKE